MTRELLQTAKLTTQANRFAYLRRVLYKKTARQEVARRLKDRR